MVTDTEHTVRDTTYETHVKEKTRNIIGYLNRNNN